MATTLDIGSANEIAAPPMIALALQGSTTVKNVVGGTLNHFTHKNAQSPAFTTTAGNTQTHSTVGLVLLQPTGRTTITITGPGF